MKYKLATDLLTKELVRLGGEVFARYMVEQDEKSKSSVEAAEFMKQLFDGKINKKDEHFLKSYLEPMWEINSAIKKLEK